MNISDKTIIETIEYISKKEMNMEFKKKVIEILNNENIDERNAQIISHINFFLKHLY